MFYTHTFLAAVGPLPKPLPPALHTGALAEHPSAGFEHPPEDGQARGGHRTARDSTIRTPEVRTKKKLTTGEVRGQEGTRVLYVKRWATGEVFGSGPTF